MYIEFEFKGGSKKSYIFLHKMESIENINNAENIETVSVMRDCGYCHQQKQIPLHKRYCPECLELVKQKILNRSNKPRECGLCHRYTKISQHKRYCEECLEIIKTQNEEKRIKERECCFCHKYTKVAQYNKYCDECLELAKARKNEKKKIYKQEKRSEANNKKAEAKAKLPAEKGKEVKLHKCMGCENQALGRAKYCHECKPKIMELKTLKMRENSKKYYEKNKGIKCVIEAVDSAIETLTKEKTVYQIDLGPMQAWRVLSKEEIEEYDKEKIISARGPPPAYDRQKQNMRTPGAPGLEEIESWDKTETTEIESWDKTETTEIII